MYVAPYTKLKAKILGMFAKVLCSQEHSPAKQEDSLAVDMLNSTEVPLTF